MKVGIVNYSLGNVGSVLSALNFYKYDVKLIDTPQELESASVIVMAGVGNFKTAVGKLREYNFWDQLNEEVLVKKKPVLGICLGMQLFADYSCEDGMNQGFGWISGKVIKIEGNPTRRVPHMGWNTVKGNHPEMFKGMLYNSFYFMHSYHFLPQDSALVKATTSYGDLELVSVIQKDNITGVQFHPEKSQGDGLRFLRNFLEMSL